MKTKKLLSLLLALMMMLSVVPMYASAADPVALTRSNVKIIPPVAEPSVASYGITYSDIALTGGTLWYVSEDGTETLVPGKFIWTASGTSPINVGTVNPGLKFQPDDQTAFSTSGRLSSTSTTIVSGEWPTITILGTPTPRISKVPTVSVVEGITKTYGEATIEGGTAVDKDTNANIPGTFVIADEYKELSVEAGAGTRIKVRFIPDDLEAYTDMATAEVLVLIKKSIKFVDENGAEIVPEITVDYGTEVGDYINLFKGFATNCNETLRFTLTDEVKNAVPTVGTHEYEVTAATFKTVGVTSNYEDTVLKFKVIVEPMELAVKFLTETGGQTNPNYCEIGVTSNVLSARPQGTFAIYVDGVLLKDGLKYHEKVEWPVAVSKTYELKVVYTPVDNDPYIIEDYTSTIKKNLYWMFTSGKNVSGPSDLIACGATVDISANLTSENFAGWKVTNAAGEEVDLGLDNTSVKGTITMPDYDIHVEALEKNASSGGSGGIFDMDFGDLSEGDSEWAIINIIRNLIAMFKSFLQQLIETFQSIGD
ncbi:MAG: hypothetical protein IKB08_05755 [Clostridia bacterium]|nr:hypothetical protein [Clostridia bacterium]